MFYLLKCLLVKETPLFKGSRLSFSNFFHSVSHVGIFTSTQSAQSLHESNDQVDGQSKAEHTNSRGKNRDISVLNGSAQNLCENPNHLTNGEGLWPGQFIDFSFVPGSVRTMQATNATSYGSTGGTFPFPPGK